MKHILRWSTNCDDAQIVTKLNFLYTTNFDITHILTNNKVWQYTNCDKTGHNRYCGTIQIVTKHLLWQYTICDRTQILTENKLWLTKKATKHQLWQNTKCDYTQIVIKQKLWQKTNSDKTHNMTNHKVWQNAKCDKKK